MKTVVFCISANKFSTTLAENFAGKISFSYISYDGSKIYRLMKVITMIVASWIFHICSNYRISLLIPHTYGSFGKIKKLLYFDEISIFEDGISLFSENTFQKNHIYPTFKSHKFKNLITCDEDIIISPEIAEKIKYIPRKDLVNQLIESSRRPQILNEQKVILIDNGVWDDKEITFLEEKILKLSGEKPLILEHPSRSNINYFPVFKERIPAEVFLINNDEMIKSIYGNFSTAIVNYGTVAGYSKVKFIEKHCRTHLSRISRIGADLV